MHAFDKHRDDRELVRRIKAGKHSAFRELLRRYQDLCYRIAWRQLHSREEAEDVVQNVFIRIWSNPEAWNENNGAAFSTWIYRVTINAAIDIQRRKRHAHESLDLHPNIESSCESITESIYQSERKQILINGIQQLPESQQQALNLVYYQQLSMKQAAAVLQTTPKAVESLLGRARSSLKQRLQLEPRLDKAS